MKLYNYQYFFLHFKCCDDYVYRLCGFVFSRHFLSSSLFGCFFHFCVCSLPPAAPLSRSISALPVCDCAYHSVRCCKLMGLRDLDRVRVTPSTATGTSSGVAGPATPSTTKASGVATPPVVDDETPLSTEGGSSTGREESFVVGMGILCMGAFTIYSAWRSSSRGSPQLLWGGEGRRLLNGGENTTLGATGAKTNFKPKLVLVNFPRKLRGQLQHCLSPLVSTDEVELVDAPVVFYHEATELTAGNVASVVRREVLAAFDELERIPCVVYHSAIAVDGGALDPFWSARRAVDASRGRAFHECHCIGYTVDGSRVEVLEHDVHGKVASTLSEEAFACPGTAHGLSGVSEALRHHFSVTPDTFSTQRTECLDHGKHFKPCTSHYPSGGSCSSAVRTLWLSAAPLFSMFAAALRFSRPEFDGWHYLSERRTGSQLLPWLRNVLKWGKPKGERPVEGGHEVEGVQQKGSLMLEITISQDVSTLRGAGCDALREVLVGAYGNKDSGQCKGVRIGISPQMKGGGAVVSCYFPSSLSVFQALRESWRVVSFVAHATFDVVSFRLLAPVIIDSSGAGVPVVDTSETSAPTPMFPRSRQDLEACPSFFSSTQYFCTLSGETFLDSEEAFRRMREGNARDLHYVIVEYSTNDLVV
ncbi:hypothetical protein, conserved [Trypanosoma brucei brucei TREU927]|uniref:Uncharacterized protein n=1 Tax=Trypanosoma brucei brucei (strain 927/4 GUTat10.1) TaxID=185431 RepID=Q389Q4_TRYB2|nr:hypothetical protein, conserved [Trypanosoma brucei brucei TREU927]EAN78466.1 hypothetical protein, conserved [Trypanosoma brucei brucei TREU927]